MLDYDSTWLFDTFAGVYAWFTAQSAWRASCALMGQHLPHSGGGRRLLVVDLGCGPGVSTFEMARQRPDAVYIGLDRSHHMLQEARGRQLRDGPGVGFIRWVRADAAALPFGSGSVDVLTGHSFLYLLGKNNRSRALGEMLRVLRPDGRVVLMEPHARPLTVRQALHLNAGVRHLIAVTLWRPFSRVHVRYTPDSLSSTLRHFGMVGTQTEEVLGGLGILASARKAA